MLVGQKHSFRFFKMNVIWRADVDHVHEIIARKFVQRCVSTVKPQRGACFFSALRRAAENAGYMNALSPQRFEMRSADKAQTDNCRAQVVHLGAGKKLRSREVYRKVVESAPFKNLNQIGRASCRERVKNTEVD